MNAYDRWLEAPYQRMYAQEEAHEWVTDKLLGDEAICRHHVHESYIALMDLRRVHGLLFHCDGCSGRALVAGWRDVDDVEEIVAEQLGEDVRFEHLHEPCGSCIDEELEALAEDAAEWKAEQQMP